MAKKTRTEILEALEKIIGDRTDDETMAFVEDFTDTLDSLEESSRDTTNWKEKYEQNDAEWRKKYRDRFFKSSSDEPDDDDDDEPKQEPLTYENLFKPKETK